MRQPMLALWLMKSRNLMLVYVSNSITKMLYVRSPPPRRGAPLPVRNSKFGRANTSKWFLVSQPSKSQKHSHYGYLQGPFKATAQILPGLWQQSCPSLLLLRTLHTVYSATTQCLSKARRFMSSPITLLLMAAWTHSAPGNGKIKMSTDTRHLFTNWHLLLMLDWGGCAIF